MRKLGAPKARPAPRPTPASRAGSIRSTKSTKSAKKAAEQEPEESSDEEPPQMSRRKSLSRRKSEAGSKPPSRAPSRASRKRSDSTATAPSEKEDKKEKEKEAKAEKSSHRISVVGSWSAMSSMMGRGKKDKEKEKEKDKDRFAELDSDQSETDEYGAPKDHKRRPSIPVIPLPSTSPKLSFGLLKSSSKSSDKDKENGKDAKKRVVALHDFAAGSNDELSFRAGDQIDVVSEVLDGWWMGELGGKRGLFPTTYTEVLNSSSSSLPPRPPLPQRPSSSLTRSLGLGSTNGGSNAASSLSSLEDGAHPFGDHNATNGRGKKRYEESIQSSVHMSDTDDDSSSLMHVQRVDDTFSSKYMTGLPEPLSPAAPAPTPSTAPPIPARRGTDAGPGGSPAKKAPPPPPPRRSTLTSSPAVTPPALPSRPATLRSKSSASSSASYVTVANTSVDADGITYSPFDSPREESMRMGCAEFKQNPFKPQGFCNNCFKLHY